MPKFWKSKKFWLITIALIGIGLFIYFYFFSEKEIIITEEQEKEYYKEDDITPVSQIVSPPTNLWYNNDFKIQVIDEDGQSGLKKGSCVYQVFSFDSNGEVTSSGWKKRKCNDYQTITVGPEGDCRFEGKDSCWIYVSCKDKAGNFYTPREEEFSIKSYNIDFTGPTINQADIKKKDEKTYNFKVKTEDNIEITGCLLYLNEEKKGKMDLLKPECKNNCFLEKEVSISSEGKNYVFAYCRDTAGNWTKSEELEVKQNSSPQISLCRALPTSGTTSTEIQFEVKASDIDKDELSFYWDFGDNQTSTQKNPTHQYSKKDIFEPEVIVSDGKSEDYCSTAWVTIE